MEETIQALGGLLLRAIPTFVLVFLLHFYLKRVFFNPLEKTLAKRREATDGAREAAENAMRVAAGHSASYEGSLTGARNEILKDQEETRKRWLADQTSHLETTRAKAREMIANAKAEIADAAEAARRDLSGQTPALAAELADRVLAGRVQ